MELIIGKRKWYGWKAWCLTILLSPILLFMIVFVTIITGIERLLR